MVRLRLMVRSVGHQRAPAMVHVGEANRCSVTIASMAHSGNAAAPVGRFVGRSPPPADEVANTRHPASLEALAEGIDPVVLAPPSGDAALSAYAALLWEGASTTSCASRGDVWNHRYLPCSSARPSGTANATSACRSLTARRTAGIPPFHPGCPARRTRCCGPPAIPVTIPHGSHSHWPPGHTASATTSWNRSRAAPGPPRRLPAPTVRNFRLATAAASRVPAATGPVPQPQQPAVPRGSPDASDYPVATTGTPAPDTLPSSVIRAAEHLPPGIPCSSIYSLFFDTAEPAATTANSLCCTFPYNAAYADSAASPTARSMPS